MGIFDRFIKFLGFEVEEKPKQPKKAKEKNVVNAKFELSQQQNTQTQESSTNVEIPQDCKLITPQTQEDIQEAITKLKQEKQLKLDLSALTYDMQRVMDFLCGAIFALDGEVISCEDNIFIIKIGEYCEDK